MIERTELKPAPTDQELLDQAKAGNIDAYYQLFEGRKPRLLRFLGSRMGSRIGPEDAEDLLSDVFIHSWEAIHDPTKTPRKNFDNWIISFAKVELFSAYRTNTKPRTRPFSLVEEEIGMPGATTDEQEVEPVSIKPRLKLEDVAQILSSRQKEVFMLRQHEGLSRQVTATRLGLTLRTLENDSKLIREKIEDGFLTPKGFKKVSDLTHLSGIPVERANSAIEENRLPAFKLFDRYYTHPKDFENWKQRIRKRGKERLKPKTKIQQVQDLLSFENVSRFLTKGESEVYRLRQIIGLGVRQTADQLDKTPEAIESRSVSAMKRIVEKIFAPNHLENVYKIAERFAVPKSTCFSAIYKGKLPAVQLFNRWYTSEKAFLRWFRKGKPKEISQEMLRRLQILKFIPISLLSHAEYTKLAREKKKRAVFRFNRLLVIRESDYRKFQGETRRDYKPDWEAENINNLRPLASFAQTRTERHRLTYYAQQDKLPAVKINDVWFTMQEAIDDFLNGTKKSSLYDQQDTAESGTTSKQKFSDWVLENPQRSKKEASNLLSPHLAKTFVMWVDGNSPYEISRLTGWNASSVRMWLSKARKRLSEIHCLTLESRYQGSIGRQQELKLCLEQAQNGQISAALRLLGFWPRTLEGHLRQIPHERKLAYLTKVLDIVVKDVQRISWQGTTALAHRITKILNNARISEHRRAVRRRDMFRSRLVPFSDIQLATAGPEEQVVTKPALDEVMKVIQGLAEHQRYVIVLRFVNGLSVAETALVLGRSESNVKQTQRKAVTKLQKLSEKSKLESSIRLLG